MIGRLCGTVVDKTNPGKFVLDVNGVGYDVETSLQTFFLMESMTDSVVLHIHTVVREDAFLLYGFQSLEERELFRALIKVNGVGPKLAITVLSSIQPAEFMQTIASRDVALLNRIPGVGKKTAERLLIELKDLPTKMDLQFDARDAQQKRMKDESGEAVSALIALGYKSAEVSKAMKQVDTGDKSCEQLIREGLKWLSSKA